jgi:hypothetical protein
VARAYAGQPPLPAARPLVDNRVPLTCCPTPCWGRRKKQIMDAKAPKALGVGVVGEASAPPAMPGPFGCASAQKAPNSGLHLLATDSPLDF